MQLEEVLAELEAFGSPAIKKIFMNHGAPEPFWGVKVGDMKTILKKIKNNQALAMQLYDTGISDAMYLAGLVADGNKMSKTEIQKWAKNASWYMISEYTFPWVAAESKYGQELALEWIESDNEKIGAAGWRTLSDIVSIKPDSKLDIDLFKKMLERVQNSIHQNPNRVRHCMNGFVIALGTYVSALTKAAMEVALKNGKVSVNMGNTACKVPYAPDYIQKISDIGRIGLKKKTAKC